MVRRIRVRRGTAADWSTINPILSEGEFGYSTSDQVVKIGNGTSSWNTLGKLIKENDSPRFSSLGLGAPAPVDFGFDVLTGTSSGNRHLYTVNGGTRFQRRGDASGWAFSYGFTTNDNLVSGGFGATGSNTNINYYFIGSDLNDTMFRATPSNGFIGLGLAVTATERLDVNGNVRIRSLATAAGDFVTASATGVLSRRTAAQVLTDIGAQPVGNYLNLGNSSDLESLLTSRTGFTGVGITGNPTVGNTFAYLKLYSGASNNATIAVATGGTGYPGTMYVRNRDTDTWKQIWTSHQFLISDYLTVAAAASTYEPVFSKNSAFNKNFGTGSGTVAEGNDSRIANGETAHSWGNHASAGYLLSSAAATTYVALGGSYANPSWLTSLAWSKISGVPSTFAPSAHNHSASEITSGTLAYARLPFTSGDVANWNSAFGWGNHAGLYAPVSGSGNYIQNQSVSAQSGSNAWLSGFVQAGNLRLSVSTISAQNTNGDIRLTPNGSGIVYLGSGSKSGVVGRLEIAYDGANNGIGIYDGTGLSFRIYRSADNAVLQRGNTPALTINASSRLLPSVDADGTVTNGLFLNGSGIMVSRTLGTGAFATIANYLTVAAAALTYEPVFSKNSAFNKNFGTASGTVAEGNDPRISNGETAFSWGNHASAGYLLSSAAATTYVALGGSYANPSWLTSLAWSKLSGVPSTFAPSAHNHSASEITSGTLAYARLPFTSGDVANWNSAFVWGNHASAGYLLSGAAATTYVALGGSYADPSWLTSLAWSKLTGVPSTFAPSSHNHSASEITSGTIAYARLPFASGDVANWNSAFGWGNHASAGYLLSGAAATTYVALGGSYANPSWITSLPWSKITGVPTYATPLTEYIHLTLDVANAIGANFIHPTINASLYHIPGNAAASSGDYTPIPWDVEVDNTGGRFGTSGLITILPGEIWQFTTSIECFWAEEVSSGEWSPILGLSPVPAPSLDLVIYEFDDDSTYSILAKQTAEGYYVRYPGGNFELEEERSLWLNVETNFQYKNSSGENRLIFIAARSWLDHDLGINPSPDVTRLTAKRLL